jgi:hypothetical protein
MTRIMAAVATFVLTLGLVVPLPAPPAAAAGPVVVHGFAYPAALSEQARSCTTGGTPTYDYLYDEGGTVGSHATGFAITSGAGGMVGVRTTITGARTLHSLWVDAYQFGAGAPDGTDGWVLLRYDPTDTNLEDDYFYAWVELAKPEEGWYFVDDIAEMEPTWTWWSGTDDVVDQAETLAHLATRYAADGVADATFYLGCQDRDFLLDGLAVGDSSGTTVYDFEGARTRSYISAAQTHHADALTRDITRLSLIYTQDHHLLGDAKVLSDTVFDTDFIDGTARLYAKRYGSSSFVQVGGARSFTADGYAHFLIEPSRQTYYQVRTAPQWCCESSTSKTLLVTVRRRLLIHVADTTVRRFRKIVVSGRVFPRDRGVPVTVQRLTSSGWRSIASGRTDSDGDYRLTPTASSIGKWTLRVWAGTSRGLVGNASPRATVSVIRNPPPAVTPVEYINPVPDEPHLDDDLKLRASSGTTTRATRPTDPAPAPPRSGAQRAGERR